MNALSKEAMNGAARVIDSRSQDEIITIAAAAAERVHATESDTLYAALSIMQKYAPSLALVTRSDFQAAVMLGTTQSVLVLMTEALDLNGLVEVVQ